MPATIPESHKDLLDGPIYVQMATYMNDGSIQVNPVWCSFDGSHILINSALGRVKDKNLRANPTITILAMDPENPYRWLEDLDAPATRTWIEGQVALTTEFIPPLARNGRK